MYKQVPLIRGRRPMMIENVPKAYCDHWTSGKNDCRCGEADCAEMEWTWEPSDYHMTTKIVDQKSVVFHSVYSQGTGIARGNRPLALNQHHFFEIKMTNTVCGTDIMVGIGSENVDLLKYKYRFVSALGIDDQSWGYSYRGIAQHDGESKYYGDKFRAGSIVGVHLDLFRGTLEFYLNRTPLGIAFRNLPVDGSMKYYPMVSSTAAKSSMKLINASSFPECLQYQAMRCISRHPGTLKELQKFPDGFRHHDRLWYLQRTEKFTYNQNRERRGCAESIFEPNPVLEDAERELATSATTTDDHPSMEELEDIYGGIDDDIARIQQCHKTRTSSADNDNDDNHDEDVEMVLFSYFCDHFT